MRGNHEGDEAGRCGGCGSRRLLQTCDGQHAVCLDCDRLQEPERRAWPESKMCDNCAFRKGSPERADPYRWAELQEVVKAGRPFYCHKGLEMTLHPGGFGASFAPPGEGEAKVCAGWVSHRLALLAGE